MPSYDRNFKQWFAYDETSPTSLRWIVDRVGNGGKLVKRSNEGIAGGLSPSGSIVVTVNREVFSVKKIIWILHYGSLPTEGDIMFSDGDITNCKIDNLYHSVKVDFPEKYGSHLREYLEYDETSPSCLRWKKIYAKGSTVKLGDAAGTLDCKDGYWRVHALGTHLKGHKAVWSMFHEGNQEGFQIDHIDGDRSNNKISNLRLVEPTVNQQNRSMNRNNSTGVTGVSYAERMQPSGEVFSKFTATYYYKAKKKGKAFSVQKYGYDEAFRLACEWREDQLAKLGQDGLVFYTDRHGT